MKERHWLTVWNWVRFSASFFLCSLVSLHQRLQTQVFLWRSLHFSQCVNFSFDHPWICPVWSQHTQKKVSILLRRNYWDTQPRFLYIHLELTSRWMLLRWRFNESQTAWRQSKEQCERHFSATHWLWQGFIKGSLPIRGQWRTRTLSFLSVGLRSLVLPSTQNWPAVIQRWPSVVFPKTFAFCCCLKTTSVLLMTRMLRQLIRNNHNFWNRLLPSGYCAARDISHEETKPHTKLVNIY